MVSFKKVINCKITSLTVAVLFIVNTTAYGIDLSSEHLRPPLQLADMETVKGRGQEKDTEGFSYFPSARRSLDIDEIVAAANFAGIVLEQTQEQGIQFVVSQMVNPYIEKKLRQGTYDFKVIRDDLINGLRRLLIAIQEENVQPDGIGAYLIAEKLSAIIAQIRSDRPDKHILQMFEGLIQKTWNRFYQEYAGYKIKGQEKEFQPIDYKGLFARCSMLLYGDSHDTAPALREISEHLDEIVNSGATAIALEYIPSEAQSLVDTYLNTSDENLAVETHAKIKEVLIKYWGTGALQESQRPLLQNLQEMLELEEFERTQIPQILSLLDAVRDINLLSDRKFNIFAIGVSEKDYPNNIQTRPEYQKIAYDNELMANILIRKRFKPEGGEHKILAIMGHVHCQKSQVPLLLTKEGVSVLAFKAIDQYEKESIFRNPDQQVVQEAWRLSLLKDNHYFPMVKNATGRILCQLYKPEEPYQGFVYIPAQQEEEEISTPNRYQDINDIALVEVSAGEEGFESAMPVTCGAEDTIDVIKDKLRMQLTRDNWWLNPKWTEKGLPKEQISIKVREHTVTIYNWNEQLLSEEQISQISSVLSEFAMIAGGAALSEVSYILIDNVQEKNPKSGEDINGFRSEYDNSIYLYPRAVSPIEHRVNGVTNLEGTLIHELSHCLTDIINDNEWARQFGWKHLKPGSGRILPGGFYSLWELKNPEKAVTNYAGGNDPGEDICDSMVAALRNHEILDKERLDYLTQKLKLHPAIKINEPDISVKRFQGSHISLPTLQSPIKFKRKRGLILEFEDISPPAGQIENQNLRSNSAIKAKCIEQSI